LISPRTISTLICIVGCVAAHSAARAANSKAVRDDSYASLGRGELQSVALRSDGTLMPTYERKLIGEAGVEIIWDTLREGKDSVLAATGHEGRLVRIVDEKTSVTLAKLSEPELTAMVKMADGSVLVAGAPSGRIYRLDADDQLTTYTQLDASFVWRMVRGEKDDVWIATGTEGKLFRLRPGGAEPQVDEIFDFESANLLDLWLDREGKMGPEGALYVAGQDPGWLYRFVLKGEKVEVVYNARAEEVRALEPYGDGLAMALNTERAPTPQALNLTLRMGGGAPVPGGTPPPGGDDEKALSGAFSVAQQQNYGPPRSEVVVLRPSGFAHSLWSSPERPIHDLALSPDGRLLAAAGGQGRLFEIEDNGDHAIVVDLREDYVLRMVQDDEGLLLTTARNGLVVDLKPRRVSEAVYLSHPLDAGSIVSWGNFYWHGQAHGGQSVKAAFRVGNDGDAESELWSPWTKDQSVKSDEPAPLPAGPARFLQYRLTLNSKGKASEPVSMDYAELFYAPPNEAPRVLEIKVASAAAPKKGGPGQGQKPGNGAKPSGGAPGTPPSPSGNAGKGGAATAGGVAERSNTMGVSVSWKVSDPNSDQLRYGLYFKADDETAWKLIDDELMKNQLSLNIGGVADGRYRFRVEASDELANPPGEGLSDELVSEQFVVDNTPPRFESPRIKVEGRRATIAFELVDDLSLISSVKVDVDNGDGYPLWPDDAIADERSEHYTFTGEEMEPGEYTATFNATDRQGNTAVHKSVFTIK